MKISELCSRSGVSVPTVKYYLRERLLHEGEKLGANQTAYDESHVQRVKLVRALIETGGLSIAATKRVLATLEPDSSLAYTFEAAQHALGVGGQSSGAAGEGSRKRIVALAASQDWSTTDENPGLEVAARVLDGFSAIGFEPSDEYLGAYADAAATIAKADLAALATRDRPELVAELMVVGTVLGDALIAGLRRLAQQNETVAFFPVAPGSEDAK
jgi:DNA-binding transcriptional MerR regulator